jgi:hypothetical protein
MACGMTYGNPFKDTDKKTKIDHVEEMILNAINNKKIPFKTVLMDSWYATQRLM